MFTSQPCAAEVKSLFYGKHCHCTALCCSWGVTRDLWRGHGGWAAEVKHKLLPEAQAECVQTQPTDIYQHESVPRSYFCNTFVSLHKLLNLIPTVKSKQFNRLFRIYSRILDLLREEFYSFFGCCFFAIPFVFTRVCLCFFIQLSSPLPIKFGASVFHNTDFTSLAIVRKKNTYNILYYILHGYFTRDN